MRKPKAGESVPIREVSVLWNRLNSRLTLAVLVTGLAVSLFGCGGGEGPTKKVAALDQDVIVNLKAFKDAEEKLKKSFEAREAELKKKIEAAQGDAEKQNLLQQAQLEMQKERNEILMPLKTRAEAAVASVAREKGKIVVLDKRIVVYGVPDITEEVKAKFETEGEITLPEEQDTTTSPIGYFDQEVVRALKVFQEAEIEIFQKRAELARDMQKQAEKADISPTELQNLQKEATVRLEAFQEQKMTPLIQAVNDSVEEVAQAEGLSLVLDKQHVMYGGRNMTNEVVETFLKKVGGGGASAETPAETPAPAATPGGE